MISTHFSGSAAAKGHQVLQTVCLNWPKEVVPERWETFWHLRRQGIQLRPLSRDELQARAKKDHQWALLLRQLLCPTVAEYYRRRKEALMAKLEIGYRSTLDETLAARLGISPAELKAYLAELKADR